MNDAHLPIAAFGGTFLMMVGLNYFFNHEKKIQSGNIGLCGGPE